MRKPFLHFSICPNAHSSRSVFYPSFPAHRPGHLKAGVMHLVLSTTPLETKGVLSTSDKVPCWGLRDIKASVFHFFFQIFFTVHAHSPVVLKLSDLQPSEGFCQPLRLTSSCHKKTKPGPVHEFFPVTATWILNE